jgi:hypothetical protein
LASARYTGPPGQSNIEVAEAIGDGTLEPGKTYELPAELVDRLVESTSTWEKAGSKSKPKGGDE